MRVRKYKHACFSVEIDRKVLVIDPGSFSGDFTASNNVLAIVITHEHGDHFDMKQLSLIIDKNPDAIIIGPLSIPTSIGTYNHQIAKPGEVIDIGPFHLEFFGGIHATIHKSMPLFENIGVLVNELLYYPGDALFIPERPIDTLALPVAAPWLKISEVIDYLIAIHPRFAFPTHDAILSPNGQAMVSKHSLKPN
jgi:L-ascorbate metabolism protein UlaG (beta-lactamase superfamily)